MFDLSLVRDALVADVATLEQVILPEGTGSQTIDTAEILVGLIDPYITGCVAPLVLSSDPTYPSATYQLISSDVIEIDGYPILRDDGYMVTISSQTYGEMRDTSESIRAALLGYAASGAGTVSIEDQADKYVEKIQLYESGIALRMTHLALPSQLIPMAFVYSSGHDSAPEKRYGDVETDEGTRTTVLLVSRVPTGGISELSTLLEEIRVSVMNVTDTEWQKPLWFGGEVAVIHNSLILWRENFTFPRNREF